MDCFVALILAMAMYPDLTEALKHGNILLTNEETP